MAAKYDASNIWKAEAQGARRPMGTSATGAVDRTTDTQNATLRPKGNATADGVLSMGAGKRRGVSAGACHRITAKLPGPSPEAQPTMANAKILPPTHSQSGNFYGQRLQ